MVPRREGREDEHVTDDVELVDRRSEFGRDLGEPFGERRRCRRLRQIVLEDVNFHGVVRGMFLNKAKGERC